MRLALFTNSVITCDYVIRHVHRQATADPRVVSDMATACCYLVRACYVPLEIPHRCRPSPASPPVCPITAHRPALADQSHLSPSALPARHQRQPGLILASSGSAACSLRRPSLSRMVHPVSIPRALIILPHIAIKSPSTSAAELIGNLRLCQTLARS